MKKKRYALCFFFFVIFIPVTSIADNSNPPDPQELVKASFNYLRGLSSVSTLDMTIHRPEWERTVTLKVWTKGEDESLFTILDPAKDKGNGTLKKGREMWMYNPKINRVIKIPPSMMSQAWMGSDFSNNDLAKTDSLIKDYKHEIVKTEIIDHVKVFHVKSMPFPDAPVIWGMLKLKIREDHILLAEEFYDEALEPVKIMTTDDLKIMGGKLFPAKWKMRKADMEDEYTEMKYKEIDFKDNLPDRIFTMSGLKNPGR